MRYTRLAAIVLAATIFTACENPYEPAAQDFAMAPQVTLVSQARDRVITTEADTFATRLRDIDNENEIIVWLKTPGEARPSVDFLSGSSRAPTLIGVSASSGESRGSLMSTNRRAARGAGVVAALSELDIEPYGRGRANPFLLIRVPDDQVEAVSRVLLKDPGVDWFEANQRRPVTLLAGPLGSNAVDAKHTALRVGGAWDHSRGSGAKIGVLDTGFGGDTATGAWHQDGTEYATYGVTKLGFVDDGGDCDSTEQADGECLAFDDNGHGTKMVGLVGANDNSLDAVGIAPKAQIYSMKMIFNALRPGLDCAGDDDTDCVEDDDWISALDWAADNSLDVASMSFTSTSVASSVNSALSSAYSDGVLLLAGIGNAPPDGYDLVDHSSVMAVGAMSTDSTRALSHNLSYWEIGGYGAGKTLLADCSGTDFCELDTPTSGTLGSFSTSAATANVAAVAGLLRAYSSSLTAAQTRTRLLNTASGLETYEMVDAEWALENVTGLEAGISGLEEINDEENHTWTGSYSGGLGSVTYAWDRKEDGGSWHSVGTGSSYLLAVEEDDPHFELRLTVSRSGRRARFIKEVLVCIPEVCNN